MIELPNSTLIGKGFGCLVIKCEGDGEMEVEGGRRSERRKMGTRDGRERERLKKGTGKCYLEAEAADESAGSGQKCELSCPSPLSAPAPSPSSLSSPRSRVRSRASALVPPAVSLRSGWVS